MALIIFAAAFATSMPFSIDCSGLFCGLPWPSNELCAMAVLIEPGQIVRQFTFLSASSALKQSIKPTTAYLEPEYPVLNFEPTLPATLLIDTTMPIPCFTICGTTALVKAIKPK